MQIRGIAIAIVFGWLVLTPNARGAPSAEDKAQARAHFDAGARHYDLSEWEQALIEFKEAYRQMPDPTFLYNIAQCHRRLGQVEDALTFYRTYLRRAPEAANRSEVERRIDELEAEKKARSAKQTEEEREHKASAAAQSAAAPPETGSEAFRPSAGEMAEDRVALTQSPAPSSSDETSIFRRWWFWTAAGALVAGGVVAGLLLTRGGGTKTFCPDCINRGGVDLP